MRRFVQKAVENFLFGLYFGLGFSIGGVMNFIVKILAEHRP